MTINMLNLKTFNIIDMKESEDDYRFLVETAISPPSYCLKCGTVANLYKHGKKQQLFFDLPMHAKRVGIFVKRQRYKCRECNETFLKAFLIWILVALLLIDLYIGFKKRVLKRPLPVLQMI